MGSPYGFDLDSECCHPDKSATLHAFAQKAPPSVTVPMVKTTRQRRSSANSSSLAGVSASFERRTSPEKIKNEGDWSLLIRVREYNGQSEDKQVTVSVHPSRSSTLPRWQAPQLGRRRSMAGGRKCSRSLSVRPEPAEAAAEEESMPDCSVINTKGYPRQTRIRGHQRLRHQQHRGREPFDTPIVVAGADSYTQLKLKASHRPPRKSR